MTALSAIGAIFVGLAFETGYNFTKELFPTTLRTSALSTASAVARIGSLMAPLIGALDFVDPALPLAIYGIIVLIAGLQSIIIWPDTTHESLPNDCQESEDMASSKNMWLSCCR